MSSFHRYSDVFILIGPCAVMISNLSHVCIVRDHPLSVYYLLRHHGFLFYERVQCWIVSSRAALPVWKKVVNFRVRDAFIVRAGHHISHRFVKEEGDGKRPVQRLLIHQDLGMKDFLSDLEFRAILPPRPSTSNEILCFFSHSISEIRQQPLYSHRLSRCQTVLLLIFFSEFISS